MKRLVNIHLNDNTVAFYLEAHDAPASVLVLPVDLVVQFLALMESALTVMPGLDPTHEHTWIAGSFNDLIPPSCTLTCSCGATRRVQVIG